jgi:hypothetical protein
MRITLLGAGGEVTGSQRFGLPSEMPAYREVIES